MPFKDKNCPISTVAIRAGLALLLFSCNAHAADANPPAPTTPDAPKTGTSETPTTSPLTTWTPDKSLLNFGGGGLGSQSVVVELTINSNGNYGQQVFQSPVSVGTGTLNLTYVPTTWRPVVGQFFDIIIAKTAVNFHVTQLIPGYSYENNFDLGNGYHSFRITKN